MVPRVWICSNVLLSHTLLPHTVGHLLPAGSSSRDGRDDGLLAAMAEQLDGLLAAQRQQAAQHGGIAAAQGALLAGRIADALHRIGISAGLGSTQCPMSSALEALLGPTPQSQQAARELAEREPQLQLGEPLRRQLRQGAMRRTLTLLPMIVAAVSAPVEAAAASAAGPGRDVATAGGSSLDQMRLQEERTVQAVGAFYGEACNLVAEMAAWLLRSSREADPMGPHALQRTAAGQAEPAWLHPGEVLGAAAGGLLAAAHSQLACAGHSSSGAVPAQPASAAGAGRTV